MKQLFDGALIREHIRLDEVDSTNRYALDAGKTGLLVTARTQTGGKGTKGRTWFSPAGSNLYMTVTLGRPDSRFPLVTGVAVREALSLVLPGETVNIKWPNDIIISGYKVCGILCESRGELTAIGVGINVNQAAWPDHLMGKAVSLAEVSGLQYDPDAVLHEVLTQMGECFSLFARYGFAPIRSRFLEFGLLREHHLRTGDGHACTIVDLTMEGHLLVDVSGKLETLMAADSLMLTR